jgi:uncharacterized cofD-like protein
MNPYISTGVKVAVIGGGTGSVPVLTGLKSHTSNIAAIVSMADDGGSTGVLRDELDVLPAGDIWKCMVALGEEPQLGKLFKYRFNDGTFKGHTVGNILFAASERLTGNFQGAVDMAAEMLHVKGRVLPATLDNVRLKMEWPATNQVMIGEHLIDEGRFPASPREARLSLVPHVTANPLAVEAINQADIVVLAPGDLYTSLGPQLVIDEISRALRETRALKVYVANLVTKPGHTDGFSVADHAAEIERFVGDEFLDGVLYNQQSPEEALLTRYEQENAHIVTIDQDRLANSHYHAVGGDFLGKVAEHDAAEAFAVAARSFIRHDGDAVAEAIMELYKNARPTA